MMLATFAARADAGTVTIEAMMIHASNDAAPMDRRLERVEFQLRRIFGFQFYKHYGEGQAVVNLPGQTALALGHGFHLDINAQHKDGKIRAQVNWIRGGESLLNTTVSMKPGNHVILGGVPFEGGTLIVTLVAR
jgi:hypothetical protein